MTTQPLPRSWRCSTAGRSKSCRSPPMTCNGFLLQHYRPGAQTASAAAGRTAEIGQGRQFLRPRRRGAARQRQRHPPRTLRTALSHPYAHRRQARRALRRRAGTIHAACKPDQDPRLARHLRKNGCRRTGASATTATVRSSTCASRRCRRSTERRSCCDC